MSSKAATSLFAAQTQASNVYVFILRTSHFRVQSRQSRVVVIVIRLHLLFNHGLNNLFDHFKQIISYIFRYIFRILTCFWKKVDTLENPNIVISDTKPLGGYVATRLVGQSTERSTWKTEKKKKRDSFWQVWYTLYTPPLPCIYILQNLFPISPQFYKFKITQGNKI